MSNSKILQAAEQGDLDCKRVIRDNEARGKDKNVFAKLSTGERHSSSERSTRNVSCGLWSCKGSENLRHISVVRPGRAQMITGQANGFVRRANRDGLSRFQALFYSSFLEFSPIEDSFTSVILQKA